jgi:hypothetical protein
MEGVRRFFFIYFSEPRKKTRVSGGLGDSEFQSCRGGLMGAELRDFDRSRPETGTTPFGAA